MITNYMTMTRHDPTTQNISNIINVQGGQATHVICCCGFVNA